MGDGERRQLDRVVALVRDVLGDDLLGAYLYGSAVLGGLKAGSDLDVMAVATRATTDEQKRRLAGGLMEISGRPRRVEVTIVVQSAVRPWRYPPRLDFQYGDWLRDRFEGGNLEPWAERAHVDLVTLLAMTRRASAPLVGPPPTEVLDPVPHEDVVRATAGDVDWLVGEVEADTANALLTLARIWNTLATGEIPSKDAAADWALERLPDRHRPALERARDVYLGEAEDRWDDLAPARAAARHVASEIERLKD